MHEDFLNCDRDEEKMSECAPAAPPDEGTSSRGEKRCVSEGQAGRVVLFGVPIVSFYVDGRLRLCLAQISSTLLRDFTYNEIHNRRVALGITCLQCTPGQLKALRGARALPASSRRCGLVTRRDAERLVRSFLTKLPPPRLPRSFAVRVRHQCGWGNEGLFLPARYNSSRAKCIFCLACAAYFSPNKFLFHCHPPSSSSSSSGTLYRHPDAANFNSWRRHLLLVNPGRDVGLDHAWEDIKAMFNGGAGCGQRRCSLAASSGSASSALSVPADSFHRSASSSAPTSRSASSSFSSLLSSATLFTSPLLLPSPSASPPTPTLRSSTSSSALSFPPLLRATGANVQKYNVPSSSCRTKMSSSLGIVYRSSNLSHENNNNNRSGRFQSLECGDDVSNYNRYSLSSLVMTDCADDGWGSLSQCQTIPAFANVSNGEMGPISLPLASSTPLEAPNSQPIFVRNEGLSGLPASFGEYLRSLSRPYLTNTVASDDTAVSMPINRNTIGSSDSGYFPGEVFCNQSGSFQNASIPSGSAPEVFGCSPFLTCLGLDNRSTSVNSLFHGLEHSFFPAVPGLTENHMLGTAPNLTTRDTEEDSLTVSRSKDCNGRPGVGESYREKCDDVYSGADEIPVALKQTTNEKMQNEIGGKEDVVEGKRSEKMNSPATVDYNSEIKVDLCSWPESCHVDDTKGKEAKSGEQFSDTFGEHQDKTLEETTLENGDSSFQTTNPRPFNTDTLIRLNKTARKRSKKAEREMTRLQDLQRLQRLHAEALRDELSKQFFAIKENIWTQIGQERQLQAVLQLRLAEVQKLLPFFADGSSSAFANKK